MKGNKGKEKNKKEPKENKQEKEEKKSEGNKSDFVLPKSIEQKEEKFILNIHAKPGSKKEGICDINDDYIEISVHAQAQNNKANFAIIIFMLF